jgi:hypothetical protein
LQALTHDALLSFLITQHARASSLAQHLAARAARNTLA